MDEEEDRCSCPKEPFVPPDVAESSPDVAESCASAQNLRLHLDQVETVEDDQNLKLEISDTEFMTPDGSDDEITFKTK